jgi:hypothetical protein
MGIASRKLNERSVLDDSALLMWMDCHIPLDFAVTWSVCGAKEVGTIDAKTLEITIEAYLKEMRVGWMKQSESQGRRTRARYSLFALADRIRI